MNDLKFAIMYKNIINREYMREIYEKIEDGVKVNVEIDLEASQYKATNPWLFSVFINYDGLDETKEGYEEFLETKESLIIAIEYEEKAKYVGSMIRDGWSEFYFYSSTSKELNTMVPAILQTCGYTYESNIVKDKKWNLYETQLFPTELQQHNMQSAKVIFLLEEEGDDLSVKRNVEHYVSFLTPTQKNKFINTLDIEGFSFKDDISSEEFEHAVALIKEHSVTYDEVTKVIAELYEYIKAEKAFYEGWSTILASDIDKVEEENI